MEPVLRANPLALKRRGEEGGGQGSPSAARSPRKSKGGQASSSSSPRAKGSSGQGGVSSPRAFRSSNSLESLDVRTEEVASTPNPVLAVKRAKKEEVG